MDTDTYVSDHNILKEPNTIQSTALYKLFPETEQFYGDICNAFYYSPNGKLNTKRIPQIKAKVKRNLNDSFSETPHSNNKNSPYLNYSVVAENEDDLSLVLRLQPSNSQPYVDLKQTNEVVDKLTSLPESPQFSRTIKKTRRISFADDKSTLSGSGISVGSSRRSTRFVERKSSYAELLSPSKIPENNLADTYCDGARFSLRKYDNDIESPRKRSRSKSVDSNQYDFNKVKHDTSVIHSPKKHIRPRRTSATQKLYKEQFTDDEQDLHGSDTAFPSPIKRTRLKRNIKVPVRYIELSDDEIIYGVKELVVSDDEDEKIISLSSPNSKSLCKSAQVQNSKQDVYLVNNDKKVDSQELEKEKTGQYFSDRWRTPVKTPRSCNKQSPKFDSSISHDLLTLISTPVNHWRLNNRMLRSSNKNELRTNSPILCKSPSKDKEIKSVQKTPTHSPKTPRSVKVPKLSSPTNATLIQQKTAVHSLRLIRAGILTPTIQSRVSAVKAASTPLNKTRIALHVAHVPDALPCREKESEDIYRFVESKLLDGCGGCMYISGVPGTGKTATITYVIRQLQAQSRSGDIPMFDYVSINGMRLTEPRQSYVEILKQLTSKIVPWEQAQNQLNTKFTKKNQASKPIVLLIDELDILCTKRQDVVYNLLDWPSKACCQLIVVTIANTMDLPERLLMGRVTSRLGLTRLTFQAYNHKQLQEIVTKRLFDSKTFNPDAIQLVARKVASVSGDARRALDICRRAAEMAEAEGKNSLVSMGHINEALERMMTQPKIRAIKCSSRLQKILLQSVVAEIERTGVEETTFSSVFKILSSVAAIDGFTMVSTTVAMAAIGKLGSCRLLLLDQKNSGLYQRIMLNVSVDDVYYALKSK